MHTPINVKFNIIYSNYNANKKLSNHKVLTVVCTVVFVLRGSYYRGGEKNFR